MSLYRGWYLLVDFLETGYLQCFDTSYLDRITSRPAPPPNMLPPKRLHFKPSPLTT